MLTGISEIGSHPKDVARLKQHILWMCGQNALQQTAGRNSGFRHCRNTLVNPPATLDGTDGTPPTKVAAQDHSRLCCFFTAHQSASVVGLGGCGL